MSDALTLAATVLPQNSHVEANRDCDTAIFEFSCAALWAQRRLLGLSLVVLFPC